MHSFSTFSTPELRLRCCPTTKIDLWDSSSSLTIFVHLPKLNPVGLFFAILRVKL
ncbi:hypothetical protein R6Q59_016982 [Mikania micrantha]